ncbi:MAG: serine/threonine-protein kinase [Ideonella sp.]
MATTLPGLLLVLAIVAAYVNFGLSHLPHRAAFAITFLACLAMLIAPRIFPGFDATAAGFSVAALLAAHCGWLSGRRSRRFRETFVDSDPDERLSTTRRRKSARRTSDDADGGDGSGAADSQASGLNVTLRIPPVQVATVPSGAGGASAGSQSIATAPEMPRPAAAPSLLVPRGGVAMSDLSRTSLGRYRIDRVIGRGSMGVVYLGLDPMLGRQVAIKTMALGREFAGSELDEVKQRFFREAETAGRLQHRDIVTIYDVGEEQELAYIAMEFLKGQDLQRHTSADKLLPVPVILRIGARVAEALAYAHTRGVIHRDVKPANVMLHLPTGAVKVTDFGIARVTDASRTRTGTVLGTPSFMSPEHLSGQRIDGRSDLYSLAVMLFQLLTGQLPFQADSMAKLMYRIANDAAPDVRLMRADLPESLAKVLARALEKDPAARHADGMQLAAELRAIDLGDGGPIAAALPSASGKSGGEGSDEPDSSYAATVKVVR